MAETTFVHTQFSDNTDHYYKGAKRDIAPPSPELSSDDLLRELDIVDIPSKTEPYPKTRVSNQNIASKLYEQFVALIYWEIPGRSGIVLSAILLCLVLTRYYSLLYLSAAAFTIMTGFNLVFVNVYNLVRTTWTGLPESSFLHPYHIHIRQHNQDKEARDSLNYYVHKLLDIADVICNKGAQIVFVQDAKHTGLICVSSGLIYLVAGLISVKSFFTLIVICLFSLPVTYERHEQWINEKAELYMAKLHQAVEKYGSPSYNQAIDLYQQAGMLFLESMKKLPKSVSK